MPTRIYFRSEGAPVVTPSDWEFPNQINPVEFRATLKQNTGSAMTSKTEATGTTSPTFRAMMRFVIGPLKAQTISGTIKGQMRGAENNAGANATLALSVKIIQPNGADRAVLLGANPTPSASDSATVGNELVLTTLTNAQFKDVNENASQTLSSGAATLGDYLVIEIGFRSATTTSRNITLSYGNDNATDLGENTTDTTALNPWVEFSGTLDFSQDITTGTIPSGSTVSAPSVQHVVEGGTIPSGSVLFAPSVSSLVDVVTTAELLEGATVRALWTLTETSTLLTEGLPITAGEMASITDWSNVRLRLTANGTSGQAEVTWVELEIPYSTTQLVALPSIPSGSQLFAPTVTPGAVTVTGGTISATQLFAPTITVGPVAVTTGTISGTQLFAPTVIGAGVITTGTVASTVTLFAPSLAAVVTTGTIPTTVQLFAPSLTTLTFVTGGTISATVLFAPTLSPEQFIELAFIASTVVLFPPAVAMLPTTIIEHPEILVVSGIYDIEVVSGIMDMEIEQNVFDMVIDNPVLDVEV